MLEVKNLYKTYMSKKGTSTVALNDISLKFADRGLVFVLGKSGSGKSTLLNVLGGLDSFDGGEIVINGRSSNDFEEKDFDSYRNTYLGFIFQEFYILEDFTVEKNIELAMQLQDRVVERDHLKKLLDLVDLNGFEHRKPNELSGGQKQRVAIARALVKNPSVIFADEPTGALDSQTGRQVFETLKELSKEKLVIVVSHDREFAEEFGDRIIELQDGSVISDDSRTTKYLPMEEKIEVLDEKLILIKPKTKLTMAQIDKINSIVSEAEENIFLQIANESSFEEQFPEKIKRTKQVKKGSFKKTQVESIKSEGYEQLSLIPSKLPLYDAFKMALGNLKTKKFRLAITLFLSIMALAFFGFSNILSDYERNESYSKTFYQGDAYMMSISRTANVGQGTADFIVDIPFSSQSINKLSSEFQSKIIKSYPLTRKSENKITATLPIADTSFYDSPQNPVIRPEGFVGVMEDKSKSFDIVFGSAPFNENECAISDMFADNFIELGVRIGLENGTYVKVQPSNFDQLLGLEITVAGRQYKISGIFKTNYYVYKEAFFDKTNSQVNNDVNLKTLKANYLKDQDMYMSKIIVSDGYAERIKAEQTAFDANLRGDFLNANKPYGASVAFDYKYGLNDGEVVISALYYRDMIYGTDSTKTYDQLLLDFLAPRELDFFVPASNEVGVDLKTYAKKFSVVSIYDDIEVIGPPIVYMSQIDLVGLIDTLFVPDSILVSANLSGSELTDKIEFLHNSGYKASARHDESLIAVGELMESLVTIFYVASAVLAVFVTLLLYNFISTSINIKKKEIGILRAIGARGMDVIKIFIIEGAFIALIIAFFSIPIVAVGSLFVTDYLLAVLPVALITFSIKQVFIMIALTLLIVLLSSFLPVYKISKKKPIDAIKDK